MSHYWEFTVASDAASVADDILYRICQCGAVEFLKRANAKSSRGWQVRHEGSAAGACLERELRIPYAQVFGILNSPAPEARP